MAFKLLNKRPSATNAKKLICLGSRNYRLLFIGPPGVGKGTFAKIIGPQLNANIIDTGSLLRKIVSSCSPSCTSSHHHNHPNILQHNLFKNNSNYHLNFPQYSLGHYNNNHATNEMNIHHQSISCAHTDACNDVRNGGSNKITNKNEGNNNNNNNNFDHIPLETKKLIQTLMTKGELIPDEILLPIMLSHLQSMKSSFILDGFPRTVSQIKWLSSQNFHFNLAIRFHLPDRILLAKMLGRRTCQNCDNTYNVANIDEMNDEKLGIRLPLMNPKNPNKCDKCNGNLIQRSEDTVDTLQNRMSIYYNQTQPIIEFLNNSNPNLLLNFDIKKGIDDSNLLLSQIKEKLENSAIAK